MLHAASQDLPCLAGVGMRPVTLFDTELAGRLLGHERVGLGAMIERILGFSLEKGHSAVDWSTRPLPEPWLRYAALDVELLIELRHALAEELDEQGKQEWARQEFAALAAAAPREPRAEPWRRTSGIHRARTRRQLAAIRSLWLARDDIARRRDIAPGRVLPDSSIMEAVLGAPLSEEELVKLPVFSGPRQRRNGRPMVAGPLGGGHPGGLCAAGAVGRQRRRHPPAGKMGRKGPGCSRSACPGANGSQRARRTVPASRGEPARTGAVPATGLGAAAGRGGRRPYRARRGRGAALADRPDSPGAHRCLGGRLTSTDSPAAVRLVALAPDGLASLAQGGGAPLNAVPGWPHRDTLPLLWTAWQAGGAAWLVTADGAPVEGTPVEDTPVLGTSIQGTVVGECAAKGPLIRGAPAEIGYGLAPRARGRGYGRRLVAELVSILQGVGVSEIRAQTSADNIASRRVLERAGFQNSS